MPSLRNEVLRRAADAIGDRSELRARLRVPMRELEAWLSGAERPPLHVFLSAVDILSEAEETPLESELRRARSLRERTAQLSEFNRGARVRAEELRVLTRSTIERSRRLLAMLASAPAAARHPFILAADFVATDFPPAEVHAMLQAALNASMNETGAPRGNVQLAGPEGMSIVEQIGFRRPFLEFFARVTPETPSCCAEAHRHSRCVVVQDVRIDPIFAGTPAAGVMVDAGAIACQSTPLLDHDGGVIGMLSTHFEEPHRPSPRDLQAVEEICRRASQHLERAAA